MRECKMRILVELARKRILIAAVTYGEAMRPSRSEADARRGMDK